MRKRRGRGRRKGRGSEGVKEEGKRGTKEGGGRARGGERKVYERERGKEG